jgi:hypothetical protein
MSVISHTITARKSRRCDEYGTRPHWISPGEEYARHVAFPNDADLGNIGFWVLRICAACQTQYGRSMPPRRHAAR